VNINYNSLAVSNRGLRPYRVGTLNANFIMLMSLKRNCGMSPLLGSLIKIFPFLGNSKLNPSDRPCPSYIYSIHDNGYIYSPVYTKALKNCFTF
jgi:hypothetical protein